MKNLIQELKFPLCFAFVLFLIACEKNDSSNSNFVNPEKNDTALEKLNHSGNKTITDKTGENELSIKISSNNTSVLNDYLNSDLELVVIHSDDVLLEESFGPLAQQDESKFVLLDKLRIDILSTQFSKDVVGFYLRERINSNLLATRRAPRLVETEYVSPYVCSGGYVQMSLSKLSLRNTVRFFVEAIDEPGIETRVRSIEPSFRSPSLTIGFSDLKGVAHQWRIKLYHDASIFPIIYWTGELSI
ncbi:MAG: hypothetical protein IPL31_10745 [Saprospiraceae bacterium]|nr:hypothetical protein [Saprospiraceae bacterium]